LLVVPDGKDETPLNRIRRPPGPPSTKNFKDVLDRLKFVGSLEMPEYTGRTGAERTTARDLAQSL
jgi:hypothetical protein